MKKEIKAAIAVILSIWFFVMGFEIGVYKERKANIQSGNEVVNTVNPTNTPTAQPSTTIPTTIPTTVPTAPSTTLPPVIDPNQTTTGTQEQPSSQAPSNDPASLSKAQIVEKINGHIKALKSEQNFKAHKSENITVEVVDCSVPAAISLINNVISGIAGLEESDYVFTNGATTAGETPFACIPPENKEFILNEAGVLSAEAKTSGTDTVYTAVLVEESTTLAAPAPVYNATTVGYLDIASLDLPTVTISTADMKYPGSIVEITVNADGKVTKLVNKIPMSGTVGAKISFFEGSATIEGGQDENWTFTY